MGKGRIMGLVFGKVQIQINKCGHQVGFSGTHGQAEQIVGIRYPVKGRLEKIFIINALRVFAYLLFQLFGDLFAGVGFQTGVLEQCSRGRMAK